ncbi:MAG TPA: hypothetical protein VG755_23975 [Nannocystaceae bacterium]|nr:hypothetical protein [Nannocystaceae bacterium]
MAVLCSLVAGLCTWASTVLPWRAWTTTAIVVAIVGLTHAATALLALVGSPLRAPAWRLQAIVALTFLGWLTWNLVTNASYIAVLYGGLGRGVAFALMLAWCVAAFAFLPLSVWGIAMTGGIRKRGRARAGAAAIVVALGVGTLHARASAKPSPTKLADTDARTTLEAAVAAAQRVDAGPRAPASLMTRAPAECARAPGEDEHTALVTFVDAGGEEPVVAQRCVQADSLAALGSAITAALDGRVAPGRVAIDLVTHVHELEHLLPIADGFLVRPALDGVCDGKRCLAPWQLVAMDMFNAVKLTGVIPDLRFGSDATMLRRALGTAEGAAPEPDGLLRIVTASFVVDDDGTAHPLRHMREHRKPLTSERLRAATGAAERYIASAQADDGRFEYRLDPFTGQVAFSGFSLPRQAGTTLVVCELFADRERGREVATDALAMLTSTARKRGEVQMLAYPIEKKIRFFGLGDTALATIALLSCRDLVGDRFDADIDRMTRFLLAMQRDDGGFYPRWDDEAGAPEPGADPLYAVGQAVFALTLLEELVSDPNETPAVAMADRARVRDAVERAMNHITDGYWPDFIGDFFYLEENWHCLAARASLGHHRNDAYERFCIDYVQYKARLVFDETSEVDPDNIGASGFGNVLVPHAGGSSGFGEAGAAALALARARGESLPQTEATLKLVIEFLVQQQWTARSCFACNGPHPIAGGFSEHVGSAQIRIDYVQHALAAMGHGGRMLGLLE